MTGYKIRFTKEAVKDADKLPPKLKTKLKSILQNMLAPDPFAGKKLIGDLVGFYSYRLTYKDRIVYSIDTELRIIYIHRARTHYGQ
jgi:mRNA-degrading endonuclease RelE of RelBE toxin-antitoxin system